MGRPTWIAKGAFIAGLSGPGDVIEKGKGDLVSLEEIDRLGELARDLVAAGTLARAPDLEDPAPAEEPPADEPAEESEVAGLGEAGDSVPAEEPPVEAPKAAKGGKRKAKG
jgi:hypothetical protein